MEQLRLDGKRVVITGAASGIGKAAAHVFSANGAKLVLLDLQQSAVLQVADQIGPDAVALPCDVSHPKSVASTFDLIAHSGPIDILVNSAGVSHIGSLLTTDPDEFDRVFRVNVQGTYLCMRAAVQCMQASGGGTILNMASIAATSGLPDRFAYSMTKGAVLSMTLSVARDYLQHNIRCNCISPARVHTPFVDDFIGRNYPGQEAEMFARLSSAQPIGRMGTPEEIAFLALYLCSPASSFVTGANFPIDGGFLNLR